MLSGVGLTVVFPPKQALEATNYDIAAAGEMLTDEEELLSTAKTLSDEKGLSE